MSKYILKELRWEKSIVLSVKSIKNLKSLKYHNICDKTLLLSSISNKCENEDEKRRRIDWDIKNSWFNWK